MSLESKLPKIDIVTLLMSSYLINQFYFNEAVSIQRLFLWGSVGLYVLANFNFIARMITKNGTVVTVRNALIVVLFWFVLILLTPIFSGSGDFSYISNCFTFISWTLYLLAIVIRIRKKYSRYNTFDVFAKVFVCSMALYVIGTLILLLVPSLRDLIMEVVSMTSREYSILKTEKYYTRIGWAGFSGYATSLKTSIALCFLLYLFIKNEQDIKQNGRIFLVEYILLMLGNFFYARTGVIVAIVCSILAVFFLAIKLKRTNTFLKILISVILFLTVFIFFLSKYAGEQVVLSWMFELFLNLESGAGFKATSLTIMLRDMFFIPSLSTILLGDGFYTDPYSSAYYMSTDIGFMRLILYFGIFGTMYIYVSYIFWLNKIKKVSKNYESTLLSALLVVVFIFFEIKGESIIILVPVVLVLLMLISRKNGLDSLKKVVNDAE